MTIVRGDIAAWWELHREEESGTTYDEHGQNDATINGATLSTDAPSSQYIGSFDFDGTDDYISTVNSNLLLGGTTHTLTFFIKPDDVTTASYLGTNYNGGAYANGELEIRLYNSTSIGSYGTGSLLIAGADSGANSFQIDFDTNLTTGTWYQVDVVLDSTEATAADRVRVYVDETEITTKTTSGTPGSSTTFGDIAQTWTIGATPVPGNYFNGKICSHKIFGKAFTSTEIGSIGNSNAGVTYRSFFALSDNLLSYYKLDGDATDATGNGNNGTVNGATSGSTLAIGTAYSLDATNDNIDLGFTVDVTSDYTLAGWFQLNNVTGNKNIIGQDDATNSQRPSVQMSGSTLLFRQEDDSGTNQDVTIAGLSANTKYAFVATYDASSGTQTLYLSTGASDSQTITQPTGNQTGNLVIGYNTTTAFGALDGLADEFAVASRVWTGGEARRFFSFGAGLRYEDLDNTSPLVDGVHLALNMNGDVLDAKNNTYDGTNNGTTSATGIVDNGREFDGTNDRIEYGDEFDDVFSGDFSYGTWVNFDSLTNDQTVAGKWWDGSVRMWELDMQNGGPQFEVLHSNNAGDTSLSISGSTTISTATWYQVGYSKKGSEKELIVNGAVDGSATQAQNSTNGTEFHIGNRLFNGSEQNFVDGTMDISVIWRRGLSLTEWNAFYNAGNGVEFSFAGQLFTQTLTETVTLTQDIFSTEYFIGGTVTLAASPQQNAEVYLINDTDGNIIGKATTDVNGDYEFTFLDSTKEYHAAVQYDDGGGNQYNDESKPYLTPASRDTDLDGA